MKISLLYALAFVLLMSACKKEQSANNSGQFSFDLNGVHHSFNLVAANSGYAIYDTLGVKEKEIGIATPGAIGGTGSFPMAVLSLGQTNTLPCSDSLAVGSYKDFSLNASCNDMATNGCIGFGFYYADATNAINGGLNTDNSSNFDSAGVVNIT